MKQTYPFHVLHAYVQYVIIKRCTQDVSIARFQGREILHSCHYMMSQKKWNCTTLAKFLCRLFPKLKLTKILRWWILCQSLFTIYLWMTHFVAWLWAALVLSRDLSQCGSRLASGVGERLSALCFTFFPRCNHEIILIILAARIPDQLVETYKTNINTLLTHFTTTPRTATHNLLSLLWPCRGQTKPAWHLGPVSLSFSDSERSGKKCFTCWCPGLWLVSRGTGTWRESMEDIKG